MTTTTQRPQTQARHLEIDAMLDRVRATTAQMIRDHAPVIQAISRRADVSRAFLCQNAQARALVADALAKAGTHRQHAVRALNAEHALKTAHDKIRTQRAYIAEFLGRIRDIEHDLPADAVQRRATEKHHPQTAKPHPRC